MALSLNPSSWFKKQEHPKLEKKSFAQLVNFIQENLLGFTKKSTKDFVESGYILNPIVYRCIEERAKGVAGLELEVHLNTVDKTGNTVKQVDNNSPILKLLNNPNNFQNKKELFKNIVLNLDTSGTAFILAMRANSGKGEPINLIVLPSEDMTIVEGTAFFPVQYVYKKGTSDEKVYPIDQLTGFSDVLCIKFPNPLNPQQGLSPMSPGSTAVDLFNQEMSFNNSLLKNGGRLSGILTTTGKLDDQQWQRLTETLKTHWQGTDNAGAMSVLDGGLDYKEIGTSPKDLDFLQGMNAAAMYIASVYGVPFPLVIPDSATYNNVKDARISLYENTIIPLAEDIFEPLGKWLASMFKSIDKTAGRGKWDNICLTYNPEKIQALEARRSEKADRLSKLIQSGVITQDEAREELGWPTINTPETQSLLNINKTSSTPNLLPPSQGA